LTGDLLSSVMGPVDVPGIQTCPLCMAQCVGGANIAQPCQDDTDCPGGTCDGTPNCIGGINDGDLCTPGSVDLGDSFRTSHDCRLNPAWVLTANIGGLLLDLAFTTDEQVTVNAVDQPESQRTFCGFCRDVLVEGTDCFDGDNDLFGSRGCPDSVAQPTCLPASASTAGCGNAVPCSDDSDCTAPYESCAQRSPGAFSDGAATQISLTGAPAPPSLAGDARLVTSFCIPPTFDPTIDSASDLPGPGVLMLLGETALGP
jgi:hypothetical protein